MIICIFEEMEEDLLAKIVKEAFDKAGTESVSKARYALAKQIEIESNLSSKTIERAHKRYIEKDFNCSELQADSVDKLCKYLGYKNYAAYVDYKADKDAGVSVKTSKPDQEKIIKTGNRRNVYLVLGGILMLLIFSYLRWNTNNALTDSKGQNYMTWANTHFEKINCETKPYSDYGTQIEPFDSFRFESFRKIEVTMATPFFTEENFKPLIWYYKKNNEIEFFTAPGLHPVNGETLRKITPYIIEKYVPIHNNKGNSFLK
ncbi:hypothetical protein [Leeuwenhoekiella sp. W20_SRS_FM14]|uniref:hypothetical protein n=1 Tax=Leeuwenhoekiella sp. W20_SRS_FM14 TaxID=3240270 RepID=UPI003F95D779